MGKRRMGDGDGGSWRWRRERLDDGRWSGERHVMRAKGRGAMQGKGEVQWATCDPRRRWATGAVRCALCDGGCVTRDAREVRWTTSAGRRAKGVSGAT